MTEPSLDDLHSLRRRCDGAFARMRRFPCKLFVALVVLSTAVGEWYPISNFPMYATLGRRTSYLYVTDGVDQPLATRPQFGQGAMFLRKVFMSRRAGLEASNTNMRNRALDGVAGQQILERLVRERKPKAYAPALPDRLRLWRTLVELRQGRLERRQDLLAEFVVP